MKYETFPDYWHSLTSEQKSELAKKIDSSKPYLTNIADGWKEIGMGTARRLIAADNNIHAGMFL